MIKCIIVDDEKPARDELRYLIDKYSSFEIVSEFDQGQTVLDYDLTAIDLIFIDINMPILSGIETAELILKAYPKQHIVFVTAYDEFAVKAFELNAIDYILKPIAEDRMKQSLEKIKGSVTRSNDHLVNLFDRKKQVNQMCIHYDGKIIPVKYDEIIYIQAENKGVKMMTTKGCYTTGHKLKELEDRFNGTTLLRCHRSYMINTNLIEHIEPWFNRTYNVSFFGINDQIPISRHYVQAFNERMGIL